MKSFAVFAVLVAVALAAPQQSRQQEVAILRYENENISPDGYNYAFETSDGTKAEEQGQLKNAGAENEAIAVRGSYSFVAPDGVTYTVTYVADENGFQPQGAHLPVAP